MRYKVIFVASILGVTICVSFSGFHMVLFTPSLNQGHAKAQFKCYNHRKRGTHGEKRCTCFLPCCNCFLSSLLQLLSVVLT